MLQGEYDLQRGVAGRLAGLLGDRARHRAQVGGEGLLPAQEMVAAPGGGQRRPACLGGPGPRHGTGDLFRPVHRVLGDRLSGRGGTRGEGRGGWGGGRGGVGHRVS